MTLVGSTLLEYKIYSVKRLVHYLVDSPHSSRVVRYDEVTVLPNKIIIV